MSIGDKDDTPTCPRCNEPMIKCYIEYHDSSGWMRVFSCRCYDNDPVPVEEE